MSDFTLGLALFDFAPVVLTALAVWMLYKFSSESGIDWAWLSGVGAGLIVSAGFCKATWKLNVVLTGHDIEWLASLLFPLMAPGFALLTAGIWSALRAHQGRNPSNGFWLGALLLIGITAIAAVILTLTSSAERPWFQPVFLLASLSNIMLTVLLVTAAFRRQMKLTALLFTMNLAMVFVLIPISQIRPMTIQIHWIEQSLTTMGTAAFAYAAFRFRRALLINREDSPQGDLT